MMLRRLRSVVFPLLAAVTLFAGCARDNTPKETETATNGTLEVVADEQLRPAVDSLITGFMLENPSAKLTARYVSSLEAIQEFVSQKARIILISRFLPQSVVDTLKKNNIPIPEFEIAQDAIGVIVSAKNPLAAISMSDLGAIVRGVAKKWTDLKHAVPIEGKTLNLQTPIHREVGAWASTSEWLLDSLFLNSDSLQAPGAHRFQTSDSIIAEVKKDPSAIGFIGSSWLHRFRATGDSSVRVLSIIPTDSSSKGVSEPVMLHLAYIYEGIYPLTSRVNGYTFATPNTLPRGFMAYVTTAHGQAVFKDFDILPRTQRIKIVPSR